MEKLINNLKLTEDISKSDIKKIVRQEIDNVFSSREFEKIVSEISSDVVNELFKILWQRNNFWKKSVTK